jgi:WD40 repeat protein
LGGTNRAVVNIWDAGTGHELSTLAVHTARVEGVAFSRDGTRLATTDEDGTAKIWDTATGNELLTLSGHTEAAWGVAFNRDGTRLATSGYDSTARIWNRLATASADGTARLWDTTTGQELLTLYGDNTEMDAVAFSPDGTRLYAITDTALYGYALKPDELISLAKSRVTRSLTTAECQQYLHVASCPASP